MSKQQRLLWGIGGLVLVLWLMLPILRDLGEGLLTLTLLAIALTTIGLRILPHWRRPLTVDTRTVTPEKLEKAFQRTENLIQHLAEMAGEQVQEWPSLLAEIRQDQLRQALRLMVVGNPAVGKSAIAAHLPKHLNASFTLTESQDLVTIKPIDPADLPLGLPTIGDLPLAFAVADVVLFIIHGDLTDSEYQSLQTLQTYQKRTLLVFNKQDQYLPAQRLAIQTQVSQRLEANDLSVDVVAIAAQPQPITIRQHQPDGSIQESQTTPEPQLEALIQPLQTLLNHEAQQLIRQQTYQQTLNLQSQVQRQLNHRRREQALPTIERYQWITGATAFANPVPTLDLLAAAAISSKMVIDLGKLYHLQFSVAQAQTVATTLSTAMLKLGCVEIATQAISSVLKGHALTYIAGGLVQGISAAHLTRVAGLSLIEHFQYLSAAELVAPETNWNPEKLKLTVAKVFQAQQQLEGLKTTVQQALGRFQGQDGLANAYSSTAHT